MKFSIISHKDLDSLTINHIIEIKSVTWPYSNNEHERWMNSHFEADDLHFVMYEGIQPLAYLSLKPIKLLVDTNYLYGFGMGNVCSAFKGRGYGKKLILYANDFILNSFRPHGLLFCREALIKFYKSCNWNLIDNDSYIDSEIYEMYYNSSQITGPILYEGSRF